jgi:hypothetical protein
LKIVNVGVIGCDEIAQWMRLPFLSDLPGFRVRAALRSDTSIPRS